MGLRRHGRELALKMLFQMDLGRLPIEEVIRYFLEDTHAAPEALKYAVQLTRSVAGEIQALDALISEKAHHWKLSRIAGVDRNVLRLAAYELLHCPEIPVQVVLDEAIEIAKKYSTQESGAFVNGILDQLLTRRPGTA